MPTRRHLLQSLPAAAAGFLASCSEEPPASRRLRVPRNPLRVIATTPFAAELARGIGKAGVDVRCLAPAGVNLHLWKPKAPDIVAMRMADVVLFNGFGFEDDFPETPESLETFGVRTAVLANAIPPEDRIAAPDGSPDPHIWMNLPLWAKCIAPAAQAMADALPRYSEFFLSGAHEHRVILERLHERSAAQLGAPGAVPRRLLTSHDSMAYFAAAFGMDFRSVGNSAGNAPASLPEELEAWIRGNRVRALFHEHGADTSALRDLVPLSLVAEFRPIYSLSLAPPGTIVSATAGALRIDSFHDAYTFTVDHIARETRLHPQSDSAGRQHVPEDNPQ